MSAKLHNLLQRLVLIGGGVMRLGETNHIDEWLVKRTQSISPNVLFVPSASEDMPEYIKDFSKRYQQLGACVHTMYLTRSLTSGEIENEIFNADLIYFGGGDAELLMELVEKNNMISYVLQALKRGTIVAGISAGAVIWGTKFVNFDWNGRKFVRYHISSGFNLVKGCVISHFSTEMLANSCVKRAKERFGPLITVREREAVYWDENGKIRSLRP